MFQKIIASDIDGTLIPEETTVIPESVFRAVEAVWDAGCLFIAASGRQYFSLRELFAPVADKMAFLCTNGAGLFFQEKLVCSVPFERDLAMDIAKYVQATPNCEFLADSAQESYVIPKNREAWLHQLLDVQKLHVNEIHDFEEFPDVILKIAVWCTDGSECHDRAFKESFGDRTSIAVSGTSWIDFGIANKGIGIRNACEYFGVSLDDTIAFGDNWNDVTMLDAVAEPYIMESANEQLLAKYSTHISDVPAEIDRIIKKLKKL